jgi:hypothetical protein
MWKQPNSWEKVVIFAIDFYPKLWDVHFKVWDVFPKVGDGDFKV